MMQTYSTVTTELQDNGVLTIMLNRPERRNALNLQMWHDLDDALAEAATMDEVRVIIVGGHGKAFSAGNDLKESERFQGGQVDDLPGTGGRSVSRYGRSLRTSTFDMPMRWRHLPRPTIAMVQGPCFLNGFTVADSMDLMVAADNAQFIPGMVPFFKWPWHMPARQAKELVFDSPQVIDAERAKELGIVNRVVPLDRLVEETQALAAHYAEKDPSHLQEAKRQVNRMDDLRGLTTSLEASWSDYWTRRQTHKLGVDRTDSGLVRISGIGEALEKHGSRDAAQ
jgi:enoyl-CoA hydratase